MRGRRLLLLLTWTVATVAAVGVAWLAVSSAVADVADPVPAVVVAAPPTTPPATAPPAGSGETATTAGPATGLASSGGAAIDDAATDDSSTGETAIADNRAPSPVTQSFNTQGGIVTMSCDANGATLVSAVPHQGYTVTVRDPGPHEVAVTFVTGDDHVDFKGECEAGRPHAEVDGH